MAPPRGTEQRYDTMIIETDIDSRMRLKQSMSAVHNFGKSTQVASLSEGMSKLSLGESFDVNFIASRFPREEVASFIAKAKETKGGQDTAYILVVPTRDQNSSTVAQSVMSGFDGILFEPYSVDGLLEITRLSARVKLERSETREKAAIQILVLDVINQLDQVSIVKQAKIEPGAGMKKLRELCAILKGLDSHKLTAYFDSAVKCFEEAPVPKPIPVKRYGGISNRIKKKMEEKIISELQKSDNEAKPS